MKKLLAVIAIAMALLLAAANETHGGAPALVITSTFVG